MSPKKFLGLVLNENEILSSDPLLTKPSSRSGLDNGDVNKIHYYQDSEKEWFYSDEDRWFYENIVVLAQTKHAVVEEIRANRIHEDGVLNDAEMGEAESDSDSDYVPDYEEHQQGIGTQGSMIKKNALLKSIIDLTLKRTNSMKCGSSFIGGTQTLLDQLMISFLKRMLLLNPLTHQMTSSGCLGVYFYVAFLCLFISYFLLACCGITFHILTYSGS